MNAFSGNKTYPGPDDTCMTALTMMSVESGAIPYRERADDNTTWKDIWQQELREIYDIKRRMMNSHGTFGRGYPGPTITPSNILDPVSVKRRKAVFTNVLNNMMDSAPATESRDIGHSKIEIMDKVLGIMKVDFRSCDDAEKYFAKMMKKEKENREKKLKRAERLKSLNSTFAREERENEIEETMLLLMQKDLARQKKELAKVVDDLYPGHRPLLHELVKLKAGQYYRMSPEEAPFSLDFLKMGLVEYHPKCKKLLRLVFANRG